MEAMPHSDQYLLPTIFIWNPITYFKTLQCPLCSTPLKQHKGSWSDGSQSYKPRVLHSFRNVALLVSRIYQCSNKVLLAHDERVLELLPKNWIVPFILLHKTGYTRQFVEEILALCRNGINFYKIESMVIEARWDFHSNAEQKFWQDVLKYKVSHKETSETITFPLFTPDGGPLCQAPSNDAIAQCFLKNFLENEQYYVSAMTSLKSSSWISCDHTFKVACNIGYLREDKRWVQQYNSVFFILDCLGRVLSWQFTNSTSFDEVEKLLSNLHKRHEINDIKEIIIDNCCHWRKKLQSVFGNSTKVYLDLFHAVQRVTRILSKKHPLYSKCVNDFRLIFRAAGDNGIKRHFPTPSPKVLIENADKFVAKWSTIQHDGLVLLNSKAVHEVEKLKEHMRKGCLSNIGVGCGTNRNEALHRHINSFFHRSRLSTILAYALITVLLFSHNYNSSSESMSKKIIKPISSCIALQYKLACEKYPETITKQINECFGITHKSLEYNTDIVYNQSSLQDSNEENIFDSETSTNILLHAVQQAMVIQSMKSINNQLNKEIGIYSNLYGGVKELFRKEQTTNIPQEDTLLDNLLESNNLKRVIVPGDGNCCFLSVAHGLKEITKETNKSHALIAHLNSIGVNCSVSCEELSLCLRELTVKEWLNNQSYYQSFLDSNDDIQNDAAKFLDQTHFEGSLGDTMILAMSNFLCTPIIIFSTLQNSILPVMPRMVVCESLIPVAYNHTGSGHYDAVISKQISKERMDNDVHCRCGVNGDTPACVDQQHYQTRCKCYKLKLPCGTACKCKNCSNTFGKRSILGKRTREKHQYQISLPTSRQFIEAKSEKLAKGPWTFLENSIFVFIIEHFQLHSTELSVDNIAKAFNEIQTLSNSLYNSVHIPDNIIRPTEKSINQIRSKLQHYFNEMMAIDVVTVNS